MSVRSGAGKREGRGEREEETGRGERYGESVGDSISGRYGETLSPSYTFTIHTNMPILR